MNLCKNIKLISTLHNTLCVITQYNVCFTCVDSVESHLLYISHQFTCYIGMMLYNVHVIRECTELVHVVFNIL